MLQRLLRHDKLSEFTGDERCWIDGPEGEVLYSEKVMAEAKQCRFHYASLKTKLNPEL